MFKLNLKKYKLPDQPGVYFFLKGKKVLYVGKATSLKDRVKSYFSKDLLTARGPKIAKMMAEVTSVKYQVTRSVLEALILEANLIKKYQPPSNTDGKDDKSFNFVVMTDESFPVIKTMHGRELLRFQTGTNFSRLTLKGFDASKNSLPALRYVFGPYPHSSELFEALKIIRRIFPYRDEKCQGLTLAKKPCFNYQIGLCPGPCVGAISQKDYAKVVRSLYLLFEGKIDRLIKDLTRQMKGLAQELKFEEAEELKKKIFALQHIQDVALIKQNTQISPPPGAGSRIESYDIAHLGGKNAVGVMIVAENGELKKADYRKFIVRNKKEGSDTDALREILMRRLKHREWTYPSLLIVDGGLAQLSTAQKVLTEKRLNIPVVAVTKDKHHRVREIKGAVHLFRDERRAIIRINLAAHRFALAFHRRRRGL